MVADRFVVNKPLPEAPMASSNPKLLAPSVKLAPALLSARVLDVDRLPDGKYTYRVEVIPTPARARRIDVTSIPPSARSYHIRRRYEDFVFFHTLLVEKVRKESKKAPGPRELVTSFQAAVIGESRMDERPSLDSGHLRGLSYGGPLYGPNARNSSILSQLPSLPKRRMFTTRVVAEERLPHLDGYVRELFMVLPKKLARSLIISEFFGLWQGDYAINTNQSMIHDYEKSGAGGTTERGNSAPPVVRRTSSKEKGTHGPARTLRKEDLRVTLGFAVGAGLDLPLDEAWLRPVEARRMSRAFIATTGSKGLNSPKKSLPDAKNDDLSSAESFEELYNAIAEAVHKGTQGTFDPTSKKGLDMVSAYKRLSTFNTNFQQPVIDIDIFGSQKQSKALKQRESWLVQESARQFLDAVLPAGNFPPPVPVIPVGYRGQKPSDTIPLPPPRRHIMQQSQSNGTLTRNISPHTNPPRSSSPLPSPPTPEKTSRGGSKSPTNPRGPNNFVADSVGKVFETAGVNYYPVPTKYGSPPPTPTISINGTLRRDDGRRNGTMGREGWSGGFGVDTISDREKITISERTTSMDRRPRSPAAPTDSPPSFGSISGANGSKLSSPKELPSPSQLTSEKPFSRTVQRRVESVDVPPKDVVTPRSQPYETTRQLLAPFQRMERRRRSRILEVVEEEEDEAAAEWKKRLSRRSSIDVLLPNGPKKENFGNGAGQELGRERRPNVYNVEHRRRSGIHALVAAGGDDLPRTRWATVRRPDLDTIRNREGGLERGTTTFAPRAGGSMLVGRSLMRSHTLSENSRADVESRFVHIKCVVTERNLRVHPDDDREEYDDDEEEEAKHTIMIKLSRNTSFDVLLQKLEEKFRLFLVQTSAVEAHHAKVLRSSNDNAAAETAAKVLGERLASIVVEHLAYRDEENEDISIVDEESWAICLAEHEAKPRIALAATASSRPRGPKPASRKPNRWDVVLEEEEQDEGSGRARNDDDFSTRQSEEIMAPLRRAFGVEKYEWSSGSRSAPRDSVPRRPPPPPPPEISMGSRTLPRGPNRSPSDLALARERFGNMRVESNSPSSPLTPLTRAPSNASVKSANMGSGPSSPLMPVERALSNGSSSSNNAKSPSTSMQPISPATGNSSAAGAMLEGLKRRLGSLKIKPVFDDTLNPLRSAPVPGSNSSPPSTTTIQISAPLNVPMINRRDLVPIQRDNSSDSRDYARNDEPTEWKGTGSLGRQWSNAKSSGSTGFNGGTSGGAAQRMWSNTGSEDTSRPQKPFGGYAFGGFSGPKEERGYPKGPRGNQSRDDPYDYIDDAASDRSLRSNLWN
ncbi:hypothetical protein BJ742DRAFT_464985 [Cladochytrium replicatum]|nr:hypothetical protein BJ742DRAFT_464985 [Cladochytrium replicatum]